MTTFRAFLAEGFKNLFTPEQKKKWAKEAYAQLVSSYEKVGGIHGAGFESEEDFVQNIPFWKLKTSEGKIVAAAYYKDKDGRKRVAISSDGSTDGKKFVADIMVNDLLKGRSYAEQSSASLRFLVKTLGVDEVSKHALSRHQVKLLTGSELRIPSDDDKEVLQHPELKNFLYQRQINGVWLTKIAVGNPGQKIK
jgi:hypothetical protein